MTSKTKTILFASLIAAMILPFSSMNTTAFAEDSVTIDDENMYQYVEEIIDRKNFKKSAIIDDVSYTQNFKTKELDDNIYSVENKFVTKFKGDKSTVVMNYIVKQTGDGFEVDVADQSKLKIKKANKNINAVSGVADVPIISLGYVQGSWPATIVAEDGEEINNSYEYGSDSYSQTCWGDTNTWAMNWQADTRWQGSSSNDWRNVNWSVTGDTNPPVYFEWCIYPHYTEKTTITVSGTGYSDSNAYYGGSAYLGGWSANDIENPWDDINFKAQFKQKSIP